MSMLAQSVEILTSIVGRERISITEADRTLHARDQSAFPAHLPDVIVWPQSTAEVSAILRCANEARLPLTAWGAGTSLEGNPIPVRGGIVLNLQQMNRIIQIYENDFQVTVQPGLFYKDMNHTLARYGLFFPPDPGANASIGGMLANNAAGIRTVKYGATRDNVLALEVVLADGEIIRTGSRAVKQSSGYDLTHLFVGSEGTLAIITEATLKLAPLPACFSAVTAAFATVEAAAQVVFDVIASCLEPAALELLDTTAVTVMNSEESINLVAAPHVFMEFNGASEAGVQERLALAEEICRAYQCLDYRAGSGREARAQLWEARHRIFEVHRRYYAGHDYLLTDVAVPISQYPTLIAAAAGITAELAATSSIISHAGDGNVHLAIFFPPEDDDARANATRINEHVVNRALALGGTITGEHGVGLGKQKYMRQEHGPAALNLMRQLKAWLDPNGILNPGKVVADER